MGSDRRPGRPSLVADGRGPRRPTYGARPFDGTTGGRRNTRDPKRLHLRDVEVLVLGKRGEEFLCDLLLKGRHRCRRRLVPDQSRRSLRLFEAWLYRRGFTRQVAAWPDRGPHRRGAG
jgi:hypothetical protein